MNLLEKFILSKETHCIEKYAEDGEPCIECTQGEIVRLFKKEKVMELLHLKDQGAAPQNEAADKQKTE